MDAQVGKPASAPVGSGAHSTVKRCARPSAVVRTAQCSFGIHTLVSLRMFPRSDALQTLRKEIKEEKNSIPCRGLKAMTSGSLANISFGSSQGKETYGCEF